MRHLTSRALTAGLAFAGIVVWSDGAAAQPYPDSSVILDVTIHTATHIRQAPGSDNWPMTWADDGHQYTSWGDGGGFLGTNNDGRVSLGVARVEGPGDGYTGYNVWGGKDPETPATFDGKSYGIISIDGRLYMWVSPGSDFHGYESQTLHTSDDHGLTWTSVGWSFTQAEEVVHPTFLQFGQDYAGALDTFVYIYAVRLQNASSLQVQQPGIIDLIRVPVTGLETRAQYEFFTGMNGSEPTWTSDIAARQPVFEDSEGVGWNVSASYNGPLRRVLLCTEHTASMAGNLGMFDAPEPWGPWTTVGYHNDWAGFGSTFFWNFANKWVSADGRDFTIVFTGTDADGENDSWNTVDGSFDAITPAGGAGGTGGSGGSGAATGGSAGNGGGGTLPPGGTPDSSDDGDCGCRTVGGRSGSSGWLLAIGAALLGAAPLRRQRGVRRSG